MTRFTLALFGTFLISGAGFAGDQKVAIRFQAMVGKEKFACGQIFNGIGTTASRISPRDFRFYVHNVRLVDEAGNAVPLQLEPDGKWQLDDIALLDFENATGGCVNGTPDTNDRVIGTSQDCHGGFSFTGTVDYMDKGFAEVEFHNTGLYKLKGQYSYPKPNLGLYLFINREEDIGKFKAPALRNIAVTAPYMHDGCVKTLEDVIEHYRVGGRTIKTGPNAGVGSENPNKSEFVKPFELTAQEKADLLAFLRSLTDENLLTDPNLSNPWVLTVTQRRTPKP